MDDKKLAVLFPGIGYHCDKPLLYYSAKLARSLGYEVLPVPYAGFPEKVRGDGNKLRARFEIAWTQAEEMLEPIAWADYKDLLFIGKSIGTIVASRYAMEKDLAARIVLLTPLVETFPLVQGNAVAFHGTADPWAETCAVIAACEARSIPLYLTEGANHSLETGDALRDVRTLEETMVRINSFLTEGDKRDVSQCHRTADPLQKAGIPPTAPTDHLQHALGKGDLRRIRGVTGVVKGGGCGLF